MHPLVRASLAAASLTAVSSWAGLRSQPRILVLHQTIAAKPLTEMSVLCPRGFLPDIDGCIPLPKDTDENPALISTKNTHRERSGAWAVYEQIPKLPDRPPEYEKYQLPIPLPSSGSLLMSDYDLDRPNTEQRKGPGFRAVGHGGVDLSAPRGTPVRAMRLDNQQGTAEVIFTGDLFGQTVVTRHTLLESGKARDYLLIHGHLDSISPTLEPGSIVQDDEVLGQVGDSGSEGIVHLHLEIRQLREGVEDSQLRSTSLAQPSVSIPTDPRNVLPLR